MEYVTLSNGVKMPKNGFGAYQISKEDCARCVYDAIKVGYRLIDTAQSYFKMVNTKRCSSIVKINTNRKNKRKL